MPMFGVTSVITSPDEMSCERIKSTGVGGSCEVELPRMKDNWSSVSGTAFRERQTSSKKYCGKGHFVEKELSSARNTAKRCTLIMMDRGHAERAYVIFTTTRGRR